MTRASYRVSSPATGIFYRPATFRVSTCCLAASPKCSHSALGCVGVLGGRQSCNSLGRVARLGHLALPGACERSHEGCELISERSTMEAQVHVAPLTLPKRRSDNLTPRRDSRKQPAKRPQSARRSQLASSRRSQPASGRRPQKPVQDNGLSQISAGQAAALQVLAKQLAAERAAAAAAAAAAAPAAAPAVEEAVRSTPAGHEADAARAAPMEAATKVIDEAAMERERVRAAAEEAARLAAMEADKVAQLAAAKAAARVAAAMRRAKSAPPARPSSDASATTISTPPAGEPPDGSEPNSNAQSKESSGGGNGRKPRPPRASDCGSVSHAPLSARQSSPASRRPGWDDRPHRGRPPALRGLFLHDARYEKWAEPWVKDETLYMRVAPMWSEFDGHFDVIGRGPSQPNRKLLMDDRKDKYMCRAHNSFLGIGTQLGNQREGSYVYNGFSPASW